jgi:hypothetical protein
MLEDIVRNISSGSTSLQVEGMGAVSELRWDWCFATWLFAIFGETML